MVSFLCRYGQPPPIRKFTSRDILRPDCDSFEKFIIRQFHMNWSFSTIARWVAKFISTDVGNGARSSSDRKPIRESVQFRNSRGLDIVGSSYAPPFKHADACCVCYLHGTASCQLEGLFLVPIFIPASVSVLCFDFSGCSNYISLGMFERDDVKCAIEYLRTRQNVGRVAIWGRSMGAITALFTVSDDPTIACAACDSPFASLSELIRDIAALIMRRAFWLRSW